MKIAIDPGHGQDNTSPGAYDPGAVVKGPGTFEEATIALDYALALNRILAGRGHMTYLTRAARKDSAPLFERAKRCNEWGANILVSLHLNAYERSMASGMEIEYRDEQDKSLADFLLPPLLAVTGFKDHGNDQRTNLSILKFNGPAVLIELGFLTNPGDREWLIFPENRERLCQKLAQSLELWWVQCPRCLGLGYIREVVAGEGA